MPQTIPLTGQAQDNLTAQKQMRSIAPTWIPKQTKTGHKKLNIVQERHENQIWVRTALNAAQKVMPGNKRPKTILCTAQEEMLNIAGLRKRKASRAISVRPIGRVSYGAAKGIHSQLLDSSELCAPGTLLLSNAPVEEPWPV